MNCEAFVKRVYHDIWQGHAVENLFEYYSKDVKAFVHVSPGECVIDDIELNYEDIVNQAVWQKENFHNIQFDFKSIFSDAAQKKISICFYSSLQCRKTGDERHFRLSGVYFLNEQDKIVEVRAVMLPFYPFKRVENR
jgi:hypothetical protein